HSTKLRGYHPTPEVYTRDRIVLKCYGGGKSSFVEFVIKRMDLEHRLLFAPPVLDRIVDLEEDVIEEVVESVKVNIPAAKTLVQRKATIHADYRSWFSEAVRLCSG